LLVVKQLRRNYYYIYDPLHYFKVILLVSSSDLTALLLVVPELTASEKICPELLIVTLLPVPEFSVRVTVLVLLFIIPPELFVTVSSEHLIN
jgi:hypothetical protein